MQIRIGRIPSRWELKQITGNTVIFKPTVEFHPVGNWNAAFCCCRPEYKPVEFHPVGNWNKILVIRIGHRKGRIPSRWELKLCPLYVIWLAWCCRIPSRWELKLHNESSRQIWIRRRIPSRWELKRSISRVKFPIKTVEFHPVGNWNCLPSWRSLFARSCRIPSRWELKLIAYSDIAARALW